VNFWDRMQDIDVRIIYIVIFLVCTIAVIKPLGLPIAISNTTVQAFETMDSLEPGDVVWLDAAYSPGSESELNPMVLAVAHHAFKKDLKVVTFALWNMGQKIVQPLIEDRAEHFGKEYGVDWVNLGFRPAALMVLRAMRDGIHDAVGGVDDFGTPLSELPLMDPDNPNAVLELNDKYVDLIVVFETGSPGTVDYLTYVALEYDIPIFPALVQVSVPGALAYVQSGDYSGLIPGLRGAAEYQILAGAPPTAATGTDAQSLGALAITAFIILGNLGYLLGRKNAA